MMKLWPMLFLFVFSGCAHSDEWTKRDTRMQIAATVAIIADAYTTSKIQDNPQVYEGGRARYFIGSQPNDKNIVLYFGSIVVSRWLITRALPAKWRPYYQGTIIVDGMNNAIQNCKKGLC